MTRPRAVLLASLGGLLAACAARESAPSRGPIARRAPARAPVVASPICALEDDEWWTSSIAIDPGDGLPGFSLSAERASLSPARGGGWQARADAPLAFEGAIAEPDLVTARAVDDGEVVHLEAGRPVDRVRISPDGRALLARAWLTTRDDGASSFEVAVEDVSFGCADLRIAPVVDDDTPRARPDDLWRPVQMADFGFLAVRATPEAVAHARLRGNGLFVHVLERRGELAHVVSQWSDGSRVRGWVESATLREPEREEALAIGRAMGGLAELDVVGSVGSPRWPAPILAGVGYGSFGRIVRRRRPAGETVPTVRATAAAGTRVYASPGRGAWATITTEVTLEAFARPTCDWVAIQRIPGLDLPPLRAWVRARALRLE